MPNNNKGSYTKEELQDFARNKGIEVFDTNEQIAPRWEGSKPKDLLQVLGEQGLIDRPSLEKCMLNGINFLQSQARWTS
jgi:hypothetical protein